MKSENIGNENFMKKVEPMLGKYVFSPKNNNELARKQMSLRLKSRTDDDMGNEKGITKNPFRIHS